MMEHLPSRRRLLVQSCAWPYFWQHNFMTEEIIGLENDLLTEGANCFRITAFEFKISRTISAAFCHLCLLTEPSVVPTTYISFIVTLHRHVWLSGVKSYDVYILFPAWISGGDTQIGSKRRLKCRKWFLCLYRDKRLAVVHVWYYPYRCADSIYLFVRNILQTQQLL